LRLINISRIFAAGIAGNDAFPRFYRPKLSFTAPTVDTTITTMSVISESGLPWLAFPQNQSTPADRPPPPQANWTRRLIGTASGICLVLLWTRYAFFQAGVSDLGYFDQAVYLISRGKAAIIPTLGYPILADHGAYVLYPLALLYVIYPSILWLFAAQAVSLAVGAWFVWRLARQAGVLPRWAIVLCAAWLAYPSVGFLNVQDFHPEVLAVPALLGAVLYCRERRPIPFVFCLCVAMGASELLVLTVSAMGVWLLLSEKNRRYGLAAIVIGACWFLAVTQIMIPLLGHGHEGSGLFGTPGRTGAGAVRAMFWDPSKLLRFIFSTASAVYVIVMLAPLWWALRPLHLAPLVGAVPCVATIFLSQDEALRNPISYHSLAVAPFVFLAAISALAARAAWLSRPWMAAAWVALTMAAGVVSYGRQMPFDRSGDERNRAQRQAMIDMVGDTGGVLSTSQLTVHLMHREMAYYVFDPAKQPAMHMPPPSAFDWILLDFHEPSLLDSGAFGRGILRQYQADPKFIQLHSNNGMYLFHRIAK
jgi:uncharacterized membrane protein